MPNALPENPSIVQLKKQAKELLRDFDRRNPSAIDRFRRIRRYANLSEEDFFTSTVKLNDAQYAVALDYGFSSWRQISDHCAYRQKEKVMNKTTVEEFNELKKLPDRSMQRLLREIDASELSRALLEAGQETRDRVFANMSRRAGEIIQESMKSLGTLEERAIEVAMAKVLSVYNKLKELGEVVVNERTLSEPIEPEKRGEPIQIIQDKGSNGFTADDTIILFAEIAEKVRNYGLLSIESDIENVNDQIIKKGLQLIMDGTDPEYVESIARSMLDKELLLIRTKYEAAIDSILSIQQGDSPHLIKEKLEARLL